MVIGFLLAKKDLLNAIFFFYLILVLLKNSLPNYKIDFIQEFDFGFYSNNNKFNIILFVNKHK